MSNHIRLPSERVAQLRQIAEVKNKTIAEVIADFVRAEIKAGTIPPDIPGIEVNENGLNLTIAAKGFEVSVPMSQGASLATLLKESLNLSASDPDRKKRWIEGLAALSGVKVKRAGNGLKLVSPITGRELALNLDVSFDLADQIERTAK